MLYEGCLDLGPEDWDMLAQQHHALYREGVKKRAKRLNVLEVSHETHIAKEGVIGIRFVTNKDGVVALTLANAIEAIIITFEEESTANVQLDGFLNANVIHKGGVHLERVAALLSRSYSYRINAMYEVNENIRASDPVFQEGAHQSSLALYKQLRRHPRFNEVDMLHPYEWMRVSSTAVMTREHFKCTFLSAQMAFHLTKHKIRDKYVSFSWENLQDKDITHLIRKWVFDSNVWLRSYEFLKEGGFEEFTVQKVRLHISCTHFIDSVEPDSWKINVRVWQGDLSSSIRTAGAQGFIKSSDNCS